MKAKLTFHKLIQDTQDVAPGDPKQNHMVSRAYFTLDLSGKQYEDMSVVLRQPFGTDYATEPMEVEKTSGSYTGNWNHNEFTDAVEDYYRAALARIIRIGPGSSVRMQNNVIEFPKTYEIDIPED